VDAFEPPEDRHTGWKDDDFGTDVNAHAQDYNLSDVLVDEFALSYLERFAVRELSGENIAFLRSASQWMQAFAEGDTERSSALKTAIINDYVKAGSRQEITWPEQLKRRILDWKHSAGTGHELLQEACTYCNRCVEFDIFPRFLLSDFFQEMISLHPSSAYRAASVLTAIKQSISGLHLTALEFWCDAEDFRTQHDSASKESSVQVHAGPPMLVSPQLGLEYPSVPVCHARAHTTHTLCQKMLERLLCACYSMLAPSSFRSKIVFTSLACRILSCIASKNGLVRHQEISFWVPSVWQ